MKNAAEEREKIIQLWFAMWLRQKDFGINQIFAGDAEYIESWGPKYRGLGEIIRWFHEWNTRGKVLVWDIRQYFHKKEQTIVVWHFKNRMTDGKSEEFDGISLIGWTNGNKIASLKEFGCNMTHYDPYEEGSLPKFRDEKIRWF